MLKLSVSMITYNHEKYIADAIESIMSQEVDFDYELVIGEDYSKDSTREIIKDYVQKYPGKIRLLDRGGNVGSTKNFFDTILQCKGEYIAMMDGDDLMLPGKLQKQVNFLDNHPECSMVAHTLLEFDDNTGKELRLVKPKINKQYYDITDLLEYSSIFGNSSKMFRKSALPFNTSDQKIYFIADMYLTVMVTGNSKIGWIPDVMGKYRRHEGAMMRNIINEKAYHDEIYTLDSITSVFGDKYKEYYPPRIAYANLILGIQRVKEMDFKVAREHLLTSIRNKWNLAISQYIYLVFTFFPKKITGKMLSIIKG